MVTTKYIQATNGLDYVYSPDIAFVEVKRITAAGTIYNVSTSIVGNLIAKYVASEGRIYFSNTFSGAEKVSVMYKTNSSTSNT